MCYKKGKKIWFSAINWLKIGLCPWQVCSSCETTKHKNSCIYSIAYILVQYNRNLKIVINHIICTGGTAHLFTVAIFYEPLLCIFPGGAVYYMPSNCTGRYPKHMCGSGALSQGWCESLCQVEGRLSSLVLLRWVGRCPGGALLPKTLGTCGF